MWPLKKKKNVEPKNARREAIILSAADDLHTRVWKAMRYAGFVNPNRLGSVDSIAFILQNYRELDAEWQRRLGKDDGDDHG